MNDTNDNKQERINLRLKAQAKEVLERAASYEGKTVSSFILTHALSGAEKTIQEHEIMRLNTSDAEAFFHSLNQPVRFNSKLIDALMTHDKRVIKASSNS